MCKHKNIWPYSQDMPEGWGGTVVSTETIIGGGSGGISEGYGGTKI